MGHVAVNNNLSLSLPLQSLPTLKDEAKKLEEQVDSFKRFTEMESKVEQLENELKWAIIVEMENVSQYNITVV